MPAQSESVRVRAARFARRTLGLGVYAVGAAVGSPYARLLGLRSAAERALANGDTEDAELLAKELLQLAGRYRDDWYYGNALHNGHEILGLVHMKRRGPGRGGTRVAEGGSNARLSATQLFRPEPDPGSRSSARRPRRGGARVSGAVPRILVSRDEAPVLI